MARDYYEVLGVAADAGSRRDPAGLPQAGPHVPPRHQQGPGRRGAVQGGQRGVPRAVRSGDPARYDRFGADFRQVPEDYDERVRAGAGGRGGGFGGGGYGGGGGATAATSVAVSVATAAIDFEDLFGGMFGGGGRVRADPRRRPGGRAEADRRGGLPRRPADDHPAGPDGRAATTSTSRPVSSTVSASGWPARAAGAAVTGRPGDLYLVVRIAPHPPVPGRRPRHHVDLPARAVGGRARRHGRRSTPRVARRR